MTTVCNISGRAEWQCIVEDENATRAFARHLAEHLFPGAVIGLIGQLGSGKTFLVRALAEALGSPDSQLVNSPTFILIQEYEGRLPIYHFDAYRLKRVEDFVDLGVHEYFAGEGVCLIEWADRVRNVLPADRMEITLHITGPQSRRLTVIAYGQRHAALLEVLQKLWSAQPAQLPNFPHS